MSNIVSINTDTPAQVGVQPRTVRILTKDNLATITTAGYLNPTTLQGYIIYPTDVIEVWYDFVTENNPGTYSVFLASITNGIITLYQDVNNGNVLLPVVDGDFATFNGTTGQIKDAGYVPSDINETFVVMQSGAAVAGEFPIYSDVNGTIVNSEISPTDPNIPKVASFTGSLVEGDIPVFTDDNGTIGSAGFSLFGATTAIWGGGSTSHMFDAIGVTGTSKVVGNILTSTADVTILRISPGVDTITVIFSADPGASTTVNYIALTN